MKQTAILAKLAEDEKSAYVGYQTYEFTHPLDILDVLPYVAASRGSNTYLADK